ncbi:MAG: hypothetical protein V1809_12370 [Planctomycetota bacterium]
MNDESGKRNRIPFQSLLASPRERLITSITALILSFLILMVSETGYGQYAIPYYISWLCSFACLFFSFAVTTLVIHPSKPFTIISRTTLACGIFLLIGIALSCYPAFGPGFPHYRTAEEPIHCTSPMGTPAGIIFKDIRELFRWPIVLTALSLWCAIYLRVATIYPRLQTLKFQTLTLSNILMWISPLAFCLTSAYANLTLTYLISTTANVMHWHMEQPYLIMLTIIGFVFSNAILMISYLLVPVQHRKNITLAHGASIAIAQVTVLANLLGTWSITTARYIP